MVIAQEQIVSNAFSKQSEIFDETDKNNLIIQRIREQVQTHVLSFLNPHDRILELNAGTGIDAVFFAQKGYNVYATDNAEGMLQVLEKKIRTLDLKDKIQLQKCSFNNLEEIHVGSFNYIFSNFGGLNCTEDIESVIHQFDRLLISGGIATLVIMPRICPWEIFLALQGNFKTAFRRLKNNAASHLEGFYFNTYYYTPKDILSAFGKEKYDKICIKGLGILSPPPYLDKFPICYPKLFKTLCTIEEKIDSYSPFNAWADHFIITMRKK